MELQHPALVNQIIGFIDRILFIEKRTTVEWGGVTLYPSEIHLILFIHREQGTNLTRMAARLGVTKGAVSQTLTRLEKKGILQKSKDPYKKNELSIDFLPFGRDVRDYCLKLTADLHRQYDEYLSSLPKSDREVVRAFLTHLNNVTQGQL